MWLAGDIGSNLLHSKGEHVRSSHPPVARLLPSQGFTWVRMRTQQFAAARRSNLIHNFTAEKVITTPHECGWAEMLLIVGKMQRERCEKLQKETCRKPFSPINCGQGVEN